MSEATDTEREERAVLQECGMRLNLDKQTLERAWSVWVASRSCFSRDELKNIKPWFSCVLYLTVHPDFQTDKTKNSFVHVKGIFQLARMRPEQFYHQLQEFATRSNLDKIPQLRRAAQENTVIFHAQTKLKAMEATKICAHFFHDIFQNLFVPALDTPQSNEFPDVDVARVLDLTREFLWALFLVSKAAMPLLLGDIANMFNLLASCTDFVYINAARIPWVSHATLEHFDNDVLTFCCSRLKHAKIAGEETLKRQVHVFYYQSWRTILSTVLEQVKLTSDGPAGYFVSEVPLAAHQRDFLSQFDANVSLLRRHYQSLVLEGGLVDESVFATQVKDHDIMDGPPPTPSMKRTPLKYYRRQRLADSPQKPRRKARNSASAAYRILPRKSAEPVLHSELTQQLSDLDVPRNALRDFDSLCDRMSKKFVDLIDSKAPGRVVSLTSHWTVAKGFFFKLLGSVVTREMTRRNQRQHAAHLVQRHDALRAVMAIAADLVLFTHKDKTVSFPEVLEALEVDPFDFQQMTEVVARSASSLPQALLTRIAESERTCLLTLVWSRSHKVRACLEKQTMEPQQAFPHTRRPGTPPRGSSMTSSSSHRSSRRAGKASESSSTVRFTTAAGITETAWAVFQRRLLTLAHKRLHAMGKLVDLSEYPPDGVKQLLDEAGKSAKQILASPFLLRNLLLGGNLDSILLCSLFITLQHHRHSGTMRAMLLQYRQMDGASKSAWSSIPSVDGSRTMDLVEFYNTRFLHAMKRFVEQLPGRPLSPLRSFQESSPALRCLPKMIHFHAVSKEQLDDEGTLPAPPELLLKSNDLGQNAAVRRLNATVQDVRAGRVLLAPSGSDKTSQRQSAKTSPSKHHQPSPKRAHTRPRVLLPGQ